MGLKLTIVFFVGLMLSMKTVDAQSTFDIQIIKLEGFDTVHHTVDYLVQLRSSSNNAWGLAGQNYRLFYNSDLVVFQEGNSLLPNTYQELSVVQHASGLDASHINGDIPFSKNLGFINFSIDLSNTNTGGIFLEEEGDWLTVAKLRFKSKTENIPDNLEIIWARAGSTNKYANSFVEITEWVGFNKLTGTTGKNYYDLTADKKEVLLKVNLLLQGAYDTNTGLMHDSLRRKSYLPLVEPYTSNLSFTNLGSANTLSNLQVEKKVFGDLAEESIVDWVFLELRNKDNPLIIEATQSVLLRRNGQVVGIDGSEQIKFSVAMDSFHLVVRHRNHLGVMSQKIAVSKEIAIDFSDSSTVVFGKHARVRADNGKMLLWGGDANGDSYIVFQGGDRPLDNVNILFKVLANPKNKDKISNYIIQGYFSEDTNLDGEIRYQGNNNDILELIFFNVISHPNNSRFHANFCVKEQIVK